jgi:alpha-glucosidase
MSGEATAVDRPVEKLEVLEGHGFETHLGDDKITLPAWSGFFARVD